MDKTEIIISITFGTYFLIGTVLAFLVYHKDKEANKLIASAMVPGSIAPVILINVVICFWPLWLFMTWFFKDEISAANKLNADDIESASVETTLPKEQP